MNTEHLNNLYEEFNIANLPFGIVHDKLGDVYEKYCVEILENPQFLTMAKTGNCYTDQEYKIFLELLAINGIGTLSDIFNIKEIKASDPIPPRMSHGLSKTDVIMKVIYNDGTYKRFPISCKQSTVPKVAFAEFDVDTICREIGITEGRLKYLMEKHQRDASAINFTAAEKQELATLLRPIARNFVRWVVTGSPVEAPDNICIPTSIIKFDLRKPRDRYNIDVENGDFSFQNYKVYTIDQYIDTIMLNKKGNIKPGGFGTGLSWTYATGSKGKKIQFKG